MSKIRVLFVLASLGGGGAERVVLNLVRHIDREVFQPHLALIHYRGDYVRLLPDDVPVHDLKAKRARYAFPYLARLIGELKPDVLFSTAGHVDQSICLALGLIRQSPKLVFRSSSYASKSLLKAPFYVRWLTRWSYNRADMIIASTRAMSQDLQANFAVPVGKVKVIPNPIDLKMVRTLSNESVDHPWFQEEAKAEHPIIIAMGRLVEPKGFPYLLKAFSKVRKVFPARLAILGRGDQREKLQALAKELGIDQEVAFMGFQPNPYQYVAKANLFVLSSLWEGFPNALVEALACGTPVVSTNCPSGPAEILEDGKYGLLVPVGNVESLAQAILDTLKNPLPSAVLRKRAEDFSLDRIVRQYLEVLEISAPVVL